MSPIGLLALVLASPAVAPSIGAAPAPPGRPGERRLPRRQRWLWRERPGPDTSCSARSEPEVVSGLRAALDGAGRRDVLVLAHHPLVSGGPHGGTFGVKQHLFPLTEWRKALYLPLPIVGSLYPLARGEGVVPQDIPSERYRRMRDALGSATRGRPPLAWASGHEHGLQVIESPEWGRVLVSEGGSTATRPT